MNERQEHLTKLLTGIVLFWFGIAAYLSGEGWLGTPFIIFGAVMTGLETKHLSKPTPQEQAQN